MPDRGAVAPNAELLVVTRLVPGVGGALLTPGSLAMVESGFRPADRARAIGAWTGFRRGCRGFHVASTTSRAPSRVRR
jgi:MFS family permease